MKKYRVTLTFDEISVFNTVIDTTRPIDEIRSRLYSFLDAQTKPSLQWHFRGFGEVKGRYLYAEILDEGEHK